MSYLVWTHEQSAEEKGTPVDAENELVAAQMWCERHCCQDALKIHRVVVMSLDEGRVWNIKVLASPDTDFRVAVKCERAHRYFWFSGPVVLAGLRP